MTAAAWATLLFTFAVAISVPGPDTFMLLRLGVRKRRAALLAACGIMVGNTVWTVASLLGLSALLRALPGALPALQVVGAGVLVWMGGQSIRGGIRALRARAARSPGSATVTGTATPISADTPIGTGTATISATVTRHPLRLGLITNLSNPKALLFFAALFSQILPADASWPERGAILLALTVVGLAWFLSFAWLTSSRAFQRWFGRATAIIDIAAGAVFILVAVVILIELALLAIG